MLKNRYICSLFFIFLILLSIACNNSGNNSSVNNSSILYEGFDYLNEYYLYPERLPDSPNEFKNLSELTESLNDPYTYHLTKEETAVFSKRLDQDYASIGFGIQVNDLNKPISNNNRITINMIQTGSRAFWDGLKVGDVIKKVNSQDITGLTLDKVTELLPKEEDQSVSLEVLRYETTSQIDSTYIQINTFSENVFSLDLGNNTTYISLRIFNKNAEILFYNEVTKAHLYGARKYIIDLRDNPGGGLTSAEYICDYFISKPGELLFTLVRKNDYKQESYSYASYNFFGEKNTVILINSKSASASELVASCVQDHNKAFLVGENSFGKGVGMLFAPLTDESLLVITTFIWLSPKATINLDGKADPPRTIIPDYKVLMNNENDTQLNAALDYLNGKLPLQTKKSLAPQSKTAENYRDLLFRDLK